MNVVNIMGNVGGDPEIKNTDSTTIANFSIATKDYRGETEWHRCVAFGKTAEIIKEHVEKGDLIGITGRIQTEEYEGKYYTKIILNQFYFGSKKNRGSEVTDSQQDPAGSNNEETDDLPF